MPNALRIPSPGGKGIPKSSALIYASLVVGSDELAALPGGLLRQAKVENELLIVWQESKPIGDTASKSVRMRVR